MKLPRLALAVSKNIMTNNHVVPGADRTTLGTLSIPSVCVGTISWTKDDREELKSCVEASVRSGLNFYDTAERYGASGFEVALGLGWGACETELGGYLREAEESVRASKPRAATHARPPLQSHPATVTPTPSSAHAYLGGQRASSPAPLQPPVVATKFTPSPWRSTAGSVVAACEESRKRLGVDAIDLYQIHMPDIVQPLARLGFATKQKDEIFWDGLAECYHKGLVKNVGVSNYGPTLLAKCHAHLAKLGVPLASNQINYSLLYRGGGRTGSSSEMTGNRNVGAQATVDAGRALGVTTLAYFPLAMGLLTGKYHEAPHGRADKAGGGSRGGSRRGSRRGGARGKGGGGGSAVENKRSALETKDLRGYVASTAPLLDVMRDVAAKHGVDPAQVAINWVTCKGAVPVVGCRTVKHVHGAASSMGWRLTEAEVARLERAADTAGVPTFEGAGFKRSSEKFVGYGVETWQLD